MYKALALLLGLLSTGGVAPAQASDPRYEAILWIDGGFALDDEAKVRLRDFGITAIDAEGPEGVARAVATGLPFYVDHAIPKGFLHLRDRAFEDARKRWREDPVPANLARPACLRDPKALEAAKADLRTTLAALPPRLPLFLSLTDEPSSTRGVSPIDWCRDEPCTSAFPAFLAGRWGSKALAREVWGPRWPADGPPRPADTEDARRALFHGIGPLSTIAQWNDTRAFADAAFTDALAQLSEEARRARPGIRIALLGAQMPSAFGGFDWEELAGRFDVIEPYDFGAARDLARSTSPKADTYRTITPGGATIAREHELWQGFLGGDRGVILFDASSWTGAASRPSRPQPAAPQPIEAIADLLKTFQSERLAPWRRGVPLRAQVAILHSMASTRMHWLLDTRYDGASWFNRLTSYETVESSEAVNREAWAALLADLGLSYRFVTPRQLRESPAIDGALALVLPRAIAMSDAEVAAVRTFGESHLVVADCQLALMNQRLLLREKPALDDMFGITRPKPSGADDLVTQDAESRPSAFVPAEPRVKADGAGAMRVVGTAPVFLVHGQTATRALYLNTRIGSYVKDRLANPEAAERLRAVLRPLFIACGVRPRFDVEQLSPRPLWPFQVSVRRDGDDLLVGVELSATTGARPIDWNGPVANARVQVRVTFPGTYRAENLLTGEGLGPLNSYELEIGAARPALLRLRP